MTNKDLGAMQKRTKQLPEYRHTLVLDNDKGYLSLLRPWVLKRMLAVQKKRDAKRR